MTALSKMTKAQLLERVRELEKDRSDDQVLLKSLQMSDGGMDMSVEAGGDRTEAMFLILLDGMANMLDGHDAPNYVEFELQRRGKASACVTVRRMHRPSPHDLRASAEAERDKAQGQLAGLEAMLSRPTRYIGAYPAWTIQEIQAATMTGDPI